MHPQLTEIRSLFETALQRLRAMASDLTQEQWHSRPVAGGWSAAECIAHLNLTSEAYLPLLDAALQGARDLREATPRRFRRDLVGWLIWKASSPGGRMKASTAAAFVPASEQPSSDALIADFERLQVELLSRLAAADGLPIHRIKMASPFDARARYSLYSAFTILSAHQHRHLDQAERAVSDRRD